MGAVGTSTMAYEDYPTNVTDTLIVERNGKYQIEKYTNQDLDNYDYTFEMNHSKLLSEKASNGVNKFMDDVMKDISLDNIFNYLKKEFNFKG